MHFQYQNINNWILICSYIYGKHSLFNLIYRRENIRIPYTSIASELNHRPNTILCITKHTGRLRQQNGK